MMHLKAGLPMMAVVFALGGPGMAFADEHDDGNAQETAAALAAKTTLTQALATAEQQTGGRALRIGFEDRDGTTAYHVKVVTNDGRLSEVSVDPASGKVLRTEAEGLVSRIFDGEDREAAAKLKDARTTLAGAVAAAEQRAGGKAVEAGYENENGRMQFQVSVAKDKAVQDVKVDSATGKVLRIHASGDGEHRDEERQNGEHGED